MHDRSILGSALVAIAALAWTATPSAAATSAGHEASSEHGTAASTAGADPEHAIAIRWLGVAGFTITSGATTVALDPFFSRPGMLRTLFRSYVPDEAAIDFGFAAAPELASASEILVGHSHYDHAGDVAAVALRSSASVRGSATTDRLVRAYGLDAGRSRIIDPGDRITTGPFDVQVLESRHARVMMGRVPLPGTLEEDVEAPLHAFSFPLGDARAYLFTHRPSGIRVLATSSAAVHAPAIEAIGDRVIDVLLLATQGRDPEYVATLVEQLHPRLVIPHHYDSFFVAIDDPAASEPSDPEDLEGFEEEVRAAAAQAGLQVEVRRLRAFESLTLP